MRGGRGVRVEWEDGTKGKGWNRREGRGERSWGLREESGGGRDGVRV